MGSRQTGPHNPGRADAQRNRQRLIEVAHHALTTGDGKATLEAIAKQAGVGIGTLYRHFPTREALIEAVYLAERSRLCQAASELLAEQPPEQALRSWMNRFADYIATKNEMADALRTVIADGTVNKSQARAELSAAVKEILIAGAAAGTIRTDVTAEDVVVALVGIFSVCTLPDQREQAERLLELLMDGLRAAPSELP
jgi:AcrR family transcriptional regulator